MSKLHQRKCFDCGNVADHIDSIVPYVLCGKCGSQDTRRIRQPSPTPQQPMPQPTLYLLQNCTGGYSGNSPVFWREGGSGYTQWIDEAERFTEEKADAIIRSTRGSHSWTKHLVDVVESLAKRTVDIQDLRKYYDKQAKEVGERKATKDAQQ